MIPFAAIIRKPYSEATKPDKFGVRAEMEVHITAQQSYNDTLGYFVLFGLP